MTLFRTFSRRTTRFDRRAEVLRSVVFWFCICFVVYLNLVSAEPAVESPIAETHDSRNIVELASSKAMDSLSHSEWVHMESNEPQETRLRESGHPVTWIGRASPETMHECTFHLKNPRQADLEALVLQISDPKSPMYGKHMTKDQVQEMTRNVEGEHALELFLQNIGATITKKMTSAITATAPVSVWEQAFHTELHRIQSPAINHELVRARDYSLPKEVAPFVQLITNLIDLPVPVHRGPRLNRPIGPR